MNVNHAMYSFAFAAVAYGTGLARQAGYGPAQVLPVLAVLLIGLAWRDVEPARRRDGGGGRR